MVNVITALILWLVFAAGIYFIIIQAMKSAKRTKEKNEKH